MPELTPTIRNASRAVIIERDAVLVLRKSGDGQGLRFSLPGGGQEPGETLIDSLRRECEEEIGVRVEVGPLLYVAEFNKRRDVRPPSWRHRVEFLFRCTLPADYRPHSGHHPDKHQVGVEWLPLRGIDTQPMSPAFLNEALATIPQADRDPYIGWFDERSPA